MRNDALYAYMPRWMVESDLPTALERDVGPGAWSVYRAVVEEESARNVLPDKVLVSLDDVARHGGQPQDQARALLLALDAAGYLALQETPEPDCWYGRVVAPPPLGIDREALVERLREKKYATRGMSFRYLDEDRRKTAWRELLDMYHAVFGGKINAAISDDLRAIGEQFEPQAIREIFQQAREEGAKSLSWILTRLHRRVEREYIPVVGQNHDGDPDDIVWKPGS